MLRPADYEFHLTTLIPLLWKLTWSQAQGLGCGRLYGIDVILPTTAFTHPPPCGCLILPRKAQVQSPPSAWGG